MNADAYEDVISEFERKLGRPPTSEELTRAEEFMRQYGHKCCVMCGHGPTFCCKHYIRPRCPGCKLCT